MRLVSEQEKQKEEQKAQEMRKAAQESETQVKGFRQKLGYFWDYNKWKVIVVLVILAVACSIIMSYREETRDLTIYIAVMNAHMDSPEDFDIGEKYAADMQIDTEKLPVRIEQNLYHPKPGEQAMDETTVAAIQKYRALLTSGKVDVTVTTSWVIDEYGSAGCFWDVRKLLPEELYEEQKENLYYITDESGERIPVGIYVDKAEFLKEFYQEERPIVTVSSFSKRTDASVNFLTWLLAH